MTISNIKKAIRKSSTALCLMTETLGIIRHQNGDTVMLQAMIKARSNLRLSTARLIEALPNGAILHSHLYNECIDNAVAPAVSDASELPVYKNRAMGPDA